MRYVLALLVGCAGGVVVEKTCQQMCHPRKVWMYTEPVFDTRACLCRDLKSTASIAEELTPEDCADFCGDVGVKAYFKIESICACE